MRVEELEVNKRYVFFYPLKPTPNILINLGDLNGRPVSVRVQVHSTMALLNEEPFVFRQQGGSIELTVPGYGRVYVVEGVGPNKSIVAHSAVCQRFGCPYPAIDFHPPGIGAITSLTLAFSHTYLSMAGSIFAYPGHSSCLK